MALLAMAVWDTSENKRSGMTDLALESIYRTVDFSRHRLIVVNNGSVFETTETLKKWSARIRSMKVIHNRENLGQAVAINQAWWFRRNHECVARTDNDIQHQTIGWLDLLEECVKRDDKLGIVGVKHNDLPDNPEATDWQKTDIHPLPHTKGERWLFVENMRHVLGSAQLVNPLLIEKIGYLQPFGLYGFEDSNYALRCELAGFYSACVCGAWFNDLDRDKDTDYQNWKGMVAGSYATNHDMMAEEYRNGTRPLFVEWHS